MAIDPASLRRGATSSTAASVHVEQSDLSPRAASCSAVARPIPDPAPVTTATRLTWRSPRAGVDGAHGRRTALAVGSVIEAPLSVAAGLVRWAIRGVGTSVSAAQLIRARDGVTALAGSKSAASLCLHLPPSAVRCELLGGRKREQMQIGLLVGPERGKYAEKVERFRP